MIQTPAFQLRAWKASDRPHFAALNADPLVMKFFPSTLSAHESDALAERIENHFRSHGWGFWALETADCPFVGFVGLSQLSWDPPFQCQVPCVEIAWRLARSHWSKGLAYQAASAVIHYGFTYLKLLQIISITAIINNRSIRLMNRLSMLRDEECFNHPRLDLSHPLCAHAIFRINNTESLRRPS